MRIAVTVFAAALLALFSVSSCKKDKVQVSNIDPNCVDTVSFMNVIEPLMNQNCSTSGCHDVSSAGGYNLNGYANIAANANIILNVINHDNGVTPMPQGMPKLADSLIQKVDCWISQGKLNN